MTLVTVFAISSSVRIMEFLQTRSDPGTLCLREAQRKSRKVEF